MVLIVIHSYNANAQSEAENVQEAIKVITLFCLAGGEKYDLTTSGSLEGGISFKNNGAKGKGDITFSKTEAKGIVDGLRQEMSKASAEQASEARKCMQPYIDRILDAILGKPISLTNELSNKVVGIEKYHNIDNDTGLPEPINAGEIEFDVFVEIKNNVIVSHKIEGDTSSFGNLLFYKKQNINEKIILSFLSERHPDCLWFSQAPSSDGEFYIKAVPKCGKNKYSLVNNVN